jgi:hypothetical protein
LPGRASGTLGAGAELLVTLAGSVGGGSFTLGTAPEELAGADVLRAGWLPVRLLGIGGSVSLTADDDELPLGGAAGARAPCRWSSCRSGRPRARAPAAAASSC